MRVSLDSEKAFHAISKTPVHLKTCLWYEDESIHTANIFIKLNDEMILSNTKEGQDMQLEHKGGA